MIKQTSQEILVEFPGNLYSEKAVEQAINDFSQVTQIKKTREGSLIVLAFPEDSLQDSLEFCNYVLGLEKLERDNKNEAKE